ncbi:MAG TPA: hypothetical protein GXX25_03940 [Desulfotomaculum sp.]|nr:hypothetical protein [Desulfotomaculum sp.]
MAVTGFSESKEPVRVAGPSGYFPGTAGFSELRERLLAVLREIRALSMERNVPSLTGYAGEVAARLTANRFHLVVLGQFKRGKTTFVNALLGENLLPTAVVPLTSIVTLLEYGKELDITVHFQDGHRQKTGVTDLPAYITEEGNPGNEKKVRQVVIHYPSRYLRNGVVLIDTPGVGSIYRNNTDETYKYLPMVDAAIFLLSSDQPISQAEVEFLNDTRQYAAKMFFIMNKIDYLSPAERREAIDFARRVLKERAGLADAVVYPLSARQALEAQLAGDEEALEASQLPAFTRRLETFLMEEKGRTVLEAAATRADNALGELKLGLEMELRALDTPLQELQDKIRLFEEMVASMEQERQDNAYILKGELDRLLERMEQDIVRFQEEQNAKLLAGMRSLYQEKGSRLSNRQLLQAMEDYLQTELQQALDQWRPLLEKQAGEGFTRLVTRFTGRTNQLIAEVVRQSAQLFNLPVQGFTGVEPLESESRLYYVFAEERTLLTPDPVKISSVLPRFIFGPLLKGEMRRRIDVLVDRNCGRVRYDLSERILKSLQQFRRQLDDKFDATIAGTREILRRTLQQREKNQTEVAIARERLAGQLNRLKAIGDTLCRVKIMLQDAAAKPGTAAGPTTNDYLKEQVQC